MKQTMEIVLRKIVELLVRGLAYIPMGTASLAFLIASVIFSKSLFLWIKKGAWVIPKLHETMGLDFLHYLMDERLSGVRRYLIQGAAKTAAMPAPLALMLMGTICLITGLGLLHFAQAIKDAK